MSMTGLLGMSCIHLLCAAFEHDTTIPYEDGRSICTKLSLKLICFPFRPSCTSCTMLVIISLSSSYNILLIAVCKKRQCMQRVIGTLVSFNQLPLTETCLQTKRVTRTFWPTHLDKTPPPPFNNVLHRTILINSIILLFGHWCLSHALSIKRVAYKH